ncbi:MAG TPA: patatin-like phospholipase family protein [Acidimicrobiales bacterium]|nr:patatin-like phospholipase family protein [Acidimicrobiales bacterium]
MAGIALVLGAGGVVGHAWHAGVLTALEETTRWDPRSAEIVVGTSAGSVVGALLRGGFAAADIYARSTGGRLSDEGRRALAQAGIKGPPRSFSRADAATGPRWSPASPGLATRTVLAPWRLRPGLLMAGILPRGRVDTTAIGDAARAFHPSGWPDRSLWLCAVRLDDGHRVVFGRDEGTVDLGHAVEASCAIPGFFRPVPIDGRDHVDGGVHSPTNADVLAGLDLDLILVSSSMSLDSSALRRPALDRMVRVGHRAALQREVTVLRTDRSRVITLQPGPDDLAVMGPTSRSMDESRRKAVAERARQTTLRRLRSDRLRDELSALG